MNAAHTSQLSDFSGQRGDAKSAPKTTVAAKTRQRRTDKRTLKKLAAKGLPLVQDMLCCECLQQAEICREQAQEAARLKRFKAARGLFATAIALCQNALNALSTRRKERVTENVPAHTQNPGDDAMITADDAALRAYLQQLNIEMATYSDLARSMERPLRSQNGD